EPNRDNRPGFDRLSVSRGRREPPLHGRIDRSLVKHLGARRFDDVYLCHGPIRPNQHPKHNTSLCSLHPQLRCQDRAIEHHAIASGRIAGDRGEQDRRREECRTIRFPYGSCRLLREWLISTRRWFRGILTFADLTLPAGNPHSHSILGHHRRRQWANLDHVVRGNGPPGTCACKAADAVKNGTRSSCSPVLSSTARVAVTLITPPRCDERRPANSREPPVIVARAMFWGTNEASGRIISVAATANRLLRTSSPPGVRHVTPRSADQADSGRRLGL